jgi:DNA-binding MarR family transcriptional regulator
MLETSGASLDRVIDNLLFVLHVSHRKILRVDLSEVAGNLTRVHMGIMGMLSKRNMTVSELAKMSMVARPQMTHLVDQLVTIGCVERQPDPKDRRVINLALTDRGRELFGQMRGKLSESIRNILTGITPAELTQMEHSLETLRSVVARLQ